MAGAGPVARRGGSAHQSRLAHRPRRFGQRADRREIRRAEPICRRRATRSGISRRKTSSRCCRSPTIRPAPRGWWSASAPGSTPVRSSKRRPAASCRRPRPDTWRCPFRCRASWPSSTGSATATVSLRVEEVLSGRGVCTLHKALHGTRAAAADIMAGMEARDAQALETGRLFVQVMGHVIGDLALGQSALRRHLACGRRHPRLRAMAGRVRLCRGVPRQGPFLGVHGAIRRAGRHRRLRRADGLRVVPCEALTRAAPAPWNVTLGKAHRMPAQGGCPRRFIRAMLLTARPGKKPGDASDMTSVNQGGTTVTKFNLAAVSAAATGLALVAGAASAQEIRFMCYSDGNECEVYDDVLDPLRGRERGRDRRRRRGALPGDPREPSRPACGRQRPGHGQGHRSRAV